jgi:hypothetical protein
MGMTLATTRYDPRRSSSVLSTSYGGYLDIRCAGSVPSFATIL